MIFPHQVKLIGEKAIRDALSFYAGRMEFLFSEPRFSQWAELAAIRLNQLDLEGYVPSKWAGERFIKQLALLYADNELKKRGDESEDIKRRLMSVDIDK